MEEPRSLRSQEGKKAKLEPWASGAGMLGAWFGGALLGMRSLNPDSLSLNPEPLFHVEQLLVRSTWNTVHLNSIEGIRNRAKWAKIDLPVMAHICDLRGRCSK